MKLRLVTYNIHKGIGGVDRRYRLERIAAVLGAVAADVCLLQEVDEGVPRSRHERQVDVLGDFLGYPHRAYWPNHRLKVGHYGNALLSKFPLRDADNLSLTLPLHKVRSALHARLVLPDFERGIWIFNCHLGLAEAERRQQLRRVLHCIDAHGRGPATVRVRAGARPRVERVVVMGDLNDVWRRLGPTVLEPAGFRSVERPPLTFPAFRPLRPLDRVFVRGPVGIEECFRVSQPTARRASDHLPLVADLRVHH
jgi:endonuclease/exonuclease/phosphatase family metal-dependent hydrolase